MPPRRHDVCRYYLIIPKDWRRALKAYGAKTGRTGNGALRYLLDKAMTQEEIVHSPDVVGVHRKRWRVTLSEKQAIKNAKRRAWMKKYRERLKQRKLDAANEADASIIWTFHPTGQITTSDLDVLGSSVGTVDPSGVLHFDSTRYSKARVAKELRKLAEQGPLPDLRFELFVHRNPL